MMKNKHFLTVGMTGLVAVVSLAGCATNPPSTAPFVEVARYAGTWYEIAKYPVIFERGLVGVTATYTLRDDGALTVENRGLKGDFNGAVSYIKGKATVADATTNAKLKVRFDGFPMNLFAADYWIVLLAEDYSYAVVSNPGRSVLWILSRTPAMDDAVYDGVVNQLEAAGFDVSKLEATPQQTL